MNVERMHRIILDLDRDLIRTKVEKHLGDVVTNLQNQVNEPSGSVHQTKLVQSLDALYKALESSAYNSYSPSWLEAISELSSNLSFGINLKLQIQNIFSSNLITPAKALEDIKSINGNLKTFHDSIISLISGLKTLNIGSEILSKGECELGYTIPRIFVENKLSLLNDEIDELEFVLNHLSEAVTGKREDFNIKTISSSDFILYIILSLHLADVLSKALERILNHYKQILEIKKLKNELNGMGLPEGTTKQIDDHVNGSMEAEIRRISKEIVDEHYTKDGGRKNELENGITISLNKLANRIDKGFKMEIRVEPLDIAKDENPENDNNDDAILLEAIQARAQNIEYIQTGGKSILELPEGKAHKKDK